MKKIKILIADDDRLSLDALTTEFKLYDDFEIIGTARDGLETIELIEKLSPDVVLLDIIMPKIDGMGVLEYCKSFVKENKPVIIVFSSVSQESYILRSLDMGADYYIIKPFKYHIIAERIKQIYSDSLKSMYSSANLQNLKAQKKAVNDSQLRMLATKYMRELNIKPNMTGYTYIRDAIVISFDYFCKHNGLPKGVYRMVAETHSVSVQKVERAIRNCLDSAASSEGNIELSQKRNTNSQVIVHLIKKIRDND